MPPSKTIRTRLGFDGVFERLAEFVRDRAPKTNTLFSDGYVSGGVIEAPRFHLSYRLQPNSRSAFSGTYEVRGVVQDTGDWRLVLLTAGPSRGWRGLVASAGMVVAGGLAAALYVRELPPRDYCLVMGGVASLFLLMAVVARVGIPRLVLRRVAGIVAGELAGTLQRRGRWRVVRGPGWW
jgi:hypothetical protein